jgi:hypothetical protein
MGTDKITAVRRESCRGEKFFLFNMDQIEIQS